MVELCYEKTIIIIIIYLFIYLFFWGLPTEIFFLTPGQTEKNMDFRTNQNLHRHKTFGSFWLERLDTIWQKVKLLSRLLFKEKVLLKN